MTASTNVPPHGPGDGSRAVAVGGGHGLSRTLQALVGVVDHVTAIVTVADDGGSSGRLRRDLGVVPPGDMRMALAALCPDPELERLIQFRFDRGELDGHSLGNLILVALAELHGDDVVRGMDEAARLLGVRGRVLPCTTADVTLCADTPDGRVDGQVAVAETPSLRRVWLEPEAPQATPDAVLAVERADLIVLGPGSLYTSLIPNLLVPGIAKAVADSRAPKVLVANLREQPGETEEMALADHLEALYEHVPGVRPSVVLAHEGPAPIGPGEALAPDERLAGLVAEVRRADLLDGADGHDPAKLGGALASILRDRAP